MKTYAETCSPALARLFDNLENGNLTEAKKQARRFSSFRLSMFAREQMGWDMRRATYAAAYLKGQCSWQAYCDAAAAKEPAF